MVSTFGWELLATSTQWPLAASAGNLGVQPSFWKGLCLLNFGGVSDWLVVGGLGWWFSHGRQDFKMMIPFIYDDPIAKKLNHPTIHQPTAISSQLLTLVNKNNQTWTEIYLCVFEEKKIYIPYLGNSGFMWKWKNTSPEPCSFFFRGTRKAPNLSSDLPTETLLSPAAGTLTDTLCYRCVRTIQSKSIFPASTTSKA